MSLHANPSIARQIVEQFPDDYARWRMDLFASQVALFRGKTRLKREELVRALMRLAQEGRSWAGMQLLAMGILEAVLDELIFRTPRAKWMTR